VKYRHSFHAGNFADVLKHLILLEILHALRRKQTGFFVLDTHAGCGAYELGARNSQPRPEYRDGIARVLEKPTPDPAVQRYVALIQRLGEANGGDLHRYPGSPLIIASQLRQQDRAVLFELSPSELMSLKRNTRAHRNVSAHHADGYSALRAQLPPLERRGLVLIDPSYESQQAEFGRVQTALAESWRRWATGIFAIWYPVKRRAPVERFHAQLRGSGVRRILCAELSLFPQDSRVSLNGSGMIIVNPPFELEASLAQTLPALHAALGGRRGSCEECYWLVPE
jgi:23S rRNA (adenine2030-N6)-methyltransferase